MLSNYWPASIALKINFVPTSLRLVSLHFAQTTDMEATLTMTPGNDMKITFKNSNCNVRDYMCAEHFKQETVSLPSLGVAQLGSAQSHHKPPIHFAPNWQLC